MGCALSSSGNKNAFVDVDSSHLQLERELAARDVFARRLSHLAESKGHAPGAASIEGLGKKNRLTLPSISALVAFFQSTTKLLYEPTQLHEQRPAGDVINILSLPPAASFVRSAASSMRHTTLSATVLEPPRVPIRVVCVVAQLLETLDLLEGHRWLENAMLARKQGRQQRSLSPSPCASSLLPTPRNAANAKKVATQDGSPTAGNQSVLSLSNSSPSRFSHLADGDDETSVRIVKPYPHASVLTKALGCDTGIRRQRTRSLSVSSLASTAVISDRNADPRHATAEPWSPWSVTPSHIPPPVAALTSSADRVPLCALAALDLRMRVGILCLSLDMWDEAKHQLLLVCTTAEELLLHDFSVDVKCARLSLSPLESSVAGDNQSTAASTTSTSLRAHVSQSTESGYNEKLRLLLLWEAASLALVRHTMLLAHRLCLRHTELSSGEDNSMELSDSNAALCLVAAAMSECHTILLLHEAHVPLRERLAVAKNSAPASNEAQLAHRRLLMKAVRLEESCQPSQRKQTTPAARRSEVQDVMFAPPLATPVPLFFSHEWRPTVCLGEAAVCSITSHTSLLLAEADAGVLPFLPPSEHETLSKAALETNEQVVLRAAKGAFSDTLYVDALLLMSQLCHAEEGLKERVKQRSSTCAASSSSRGLLFSQRAMGSVTTLFSMHSPSRLLVFQYLQSIKSHHTSIALATVTTEANDALPKSPPSRRIGGETTRHVEHRSLYTIAAKSGEPRRRVAEGEGIDAELFHTVVPTEAVAPIPTLEDVAVDTSASLQGLKSVASAAALPLSLTKLLNR